MITKSLQRGITCTILITLIVSLFGIAGTVLAQQSQTTYVVQSGDTLRVIAARYNTTWQILAEVNHLANPNRIYVGQVLVIPMPGTVAQYYTVQRGDTLYSIALRYGLTWRTLAEANHLSNPNVIHTGNVLVIPSNGTVVQPPTQYVVQSGDTLSRIALRFGVSMWEIARQNNILNLNSIFAGQTLVIPS
jgi:LysM repeat protein